jgi:ABC-2 type transport system permease protein
VIAALRSALRAYPALLRVGFAEAVAYRAEFLVWMLTTTVPLIMLALWTAVARDAPVGRFGPTEFVAYYLAALVVRTVTGAWVVWEMNQEIRTGKLSMRLLRPIHPLLAYSAENLAAVPLRALIALPVAVILLVATQGARLVHDPVQIALLPLALVGAWLITFLAMALIGTLGLFMDKSIAVFELYFGLFAVLSGYIVPLELMPSWVRGVAETLWFRYMLGFPVELMIGLTSRAEALTGLAIQWTYALVLLVLCHYVWRAGLRRFEAFGA